MPRGPYIFLADVEFAAVILFPQAPAVRIAFVGRDERHARQVDLVMAVKIVEALWRDIGVMRMGEGTDQQERPLVRIACPVENPARRAIGDFLVIILLKGTLGDARILHILHVVEPVHGAPRIVPIGRPVEVGRADVGVAEVVGPRDRHQSLWRSASGIGCLWIR